MANENAKRDENRKVTLTGVTDDVSAEIRRLIVDSATGRLKVSGVVTSSVEGDVIGPASATDNAVARFDSTTGKLIQNSVVTIADTTGNMAGVGTLNTHTIPGGTDTIALLAATQTLTNKRITPRVVSMADATSITPTGDTADQNTHVNTQGAGTLTVNAPSGTPTDGQKLILRIKSTNAQTFSFNAIYRGSNDVALPTATSGSDKTDYIGFAYNSADTKWDLIAKSMNY